MHILSPDNYRGVKHARLGASRDWCNGYALALNIPVLPVTVDVWPGEMLQTLQAVQLSKNPDVRQDEIKHKLAREVFENLINRFRGRDFALYESAELTEDRAMMLAQFANEVLNLHEHGLVRQKGGLSSFHIPGSVINHPYGRRVTEACT